ncbi:DUF4328 domain-containing protein [Streptomyces sp. NPDC002588]|uniref:DUF4328 domain-containing protein n=1 Tax=Streptomyces sp. NPDC002588 TaxID=3154419 RepID=UPI00332905F2
MTISPGKAPWVLARLAQGTMAAAAVADVFEALALRAHRLHPADASPSDSGRTSMVYVYLMTAAAVFFLMWFSRSRRAAQALTPGAAEGSGVWAVVAWLIPVVNLWVPRGLLLEVLRASGSGAESGSEGKVRDDVLVNCWCAAWAAHAVITGTYQTAGGTSMVVLVVSEVFNLAAAVQMVWLVQRITARQSAALPAQPPAEPLTHA